jgi:hypothetical protein
MPSQTSEKMCPSGSFPVFHLKIPIFFLSGHQAHFVRYLGHPATAQHTLFRERTRVPSVQLHDLRAVGAQPQGSRQVFIEKCWKMLWANHAAGVAARPSWQVLTVVPGLVIDGDCRQRGGSLGKEAYSGFLISRSM